MKTNPALRTVTAARDLLAGHLHADQAITRLLVDRLAARHGGKPPTWPALPTPVDPDALAKARAHLDGLDMTGWDMNDVGTCYEQLISRKNAAWYTPPEVAQGMAQFSIGMQLDQLAAAHPDDPHVVFRIVALDPACGAGVFLVAAARLIATRYAERLFGRTSPAAVAAVMQDVMEETVFGVDIDPVAVELARAALWLEARCRPPITFMDRNVVCGDTLAGPHVQPPKLAERLGEAA